MASRTDIPIDDLIAAHGLAGGDAIRARAALEEAGLTNPRKQNIATRKIESARAVIAARFQRLCTVCVATAAGDVRTVVRVDPPYCERCAGSNNERAVRDMVAACHGVGITKLVVVGGSPSLRQEFSRLVGDDLELRFVDGTRRITKSAAQGDIARADAVVVCGATELAHKVSNLYTRDSAARRKLIVTTRRGIEAIADDITRSDVVSRAALAPRSPKV